MPDCFGSLGSITANPSRSRVNPLSTGSVCFSTHPSKNEIFKGRFLHFIKSILKSKSSRKQLWMISFIWYTVCVSIAKISLIITNFLKVVKTPKKLGTERVKCKKSAKLQFWVVRSPNAENRNEVLAIFPPPPCPLTLWFWHLSRRICTYLLHIKQKDLSRLFEEV